ncbi:MAG: hypothetical protein H6737_06450 [Alphaproteobacteria bacterium]|nr:hypothetical protein [Myxococcales bacterium]MCB9674738.1 hypothetical protein [Alphaproteobacteria bacterium]
MLLFPTLALASDWSYRAELGGQFEAASHGIANFAARRKGLELALITDTLQVRYEASRDRGRWWAAGRAEFGAVGLVSTRWVDGAPSPEASQLGFYAGPEGGAVWYGPKGTYFGAQASLRYYAFVALPATAAVADDRPVAHPEALLGWWTEPADLYVRAGVAVSTVAVSPGVHGVFRLHPAWRLAPWLEIRAGTAENTDLVTQVRLGGLNEYVVPLAGAAWAEFWVEDYAAVRVGPRLNLGAHWLAPVLDAATFDGQQAWGTGGYVHLGVKAWSFDLAAGIAPGLDRPGRSWAGSTYAKVAVDF